MQPYSYAGLLLLSNPSKLNPFIMGIHFGKFGDKIHLGKNPPLPRP